ncbi:MAG TPA: hypothetical protein VGQ76_06690 [Thermoanaerobaculia bacterium]|nr:hypothetical protein [Thermoanaerobaculia bacterium]
MTTTPETPTANPVNPTVDVIPATTPDPPATPTITFCKQLADEFMRELDEIATIIPQLETSHTSTANFVRSHVNIPNEFLATAVAAVEQTPALQTVNKLDVLAARDTLQFIEAFRPVLDKVSAFASALKFTLASRKALLAVDALQIYDIAKGLARDPGGAALVSVVANLKRDLGRGRRQKTPAPPREITSAVTISPPSGMVS